MKKIRTVKKTFSALSIVFLLLTVAGIEKSPFFGLFLIPFAVFMYASGGCYRCFYKRQKAPMKTGRTYAHRCAGRFGSAA